jgi:hypothetical protein
VFAHPVWAGWDPFTVGLISTTSITNAGSAYTNGTYLNAALTGGTGSGATANITVAGGIVTACTIAVTGAGYTAGDLLSASIPVGAGFVLTVNTVGSTIRVWQHEVGTDAVDGRNALAVESYFETNDLGWVSGGPSVPAPIGDNRWIRIERVEPDFIQSEDMTVVVTGRPFAQGGDVESAEYVFGPDTGKVDMREQRRELRLRFRSNIAGGNYQLGKILLNATIGDVRPY